MATCAQCGYELSVPARTCPQCGRPNPTEMPDGPHQAQTWAVGRSADDPASEPTDWIRSGVDTPPEVDTSPTGRRPGYVQPGAFARPSAYPSYASWLITGAGRNKLGLIGAVLVTWYNLPIGIFTAVVGMIVGGIGGYVGGTLGPFVGIQDLPVIGALIHQTPFVGDFIGIVAAHSGGILGMLVGIGLGAVAGFLVGFIGPWVLIFASQGLLPMMAVLLSQLPIAALVGVLYTTYAIGSERIRFRISGYRRPSRRELQLLGPILLDCGHRLGLTDLPILLVDDDRAVNMYTGARHLIITRGFLDEFNYDPDPIAGVFCHELCHWRNADQVSSYLIRGVALPLYIMINIASRMMNFARTIRGAGFFVWIVFIILWPYLFCVRFVIMPLQMVEGRDHEYQADQAAVAAGRRNGMRTTLARLRASFDGARNGWEHSTLATHPPNELRLERVEEPGVDYPLPDPDGPAVPMPVVVTSALDRD